MPLSSKCFLHIRLSGQIFVWVFISPVRAAWSSHPLWYVNHNNIQERLRSVKFLIK
jgi:hypothetical protein